MIPWLAIVELLLRTVSGLVDYLTTQRLIEGARAEILNQGLRETLSNLEKANAVKEELEHNPDGTFADGVRSRHERKDL